MSWLILYDDLVEHHSINKFIFEWMKLKGYSYSIQKLLDNQFYLKHYRGVIILWQWDKAETHQRVLDKVRQLSHQMLREQDIEYQNLYVILDSTVELIKSYTKIGLTLSNYSIGKLQNLIDLNQNFHYRTFDRNKFEITDVKAYFRNIKKNNCNFNNGFMF